MILDNKLSWSNHIESVYSDCIKKLNLMKKLKYVLDRKSLEVFLFIFFKHFICPKSTYTSAIQYVYHRIT